MSFNNREKADMHFIFGIKNRNGLEAQRSYGEKIPDRRLPDRKTFERLHQQLCEMRSFLVFQLDAGHYNTDEMWLNVAEAIEVGFSAKYKYKNYD